MPPVVGAPLVAVVNAPAVAQAPAGVQQLVGQVQDQVGTPMEVEDEDSILQRLFFKKYGRALPETEKEKDSEVDQINFVIDLTDDTEEMEDDTTPPLIPVIKTEPIETAEAPEIVNVTHESGVADVANVDIDNRRRSFRLERLELAKARKAITEFGKSLRKKDIIPEKEPENIIADTDTDMAAADSVNPESGNNIDKAIKTTEQVIAESDAAIKACEEFVAEWDTPIDEFDN
jgi:hypothetical protein